MKISFVTLFPEMFEPLKASLIGKAQEKNALKIEIINIRDFSLDKHKKCDDYPFGGGAGMLMTPQPIYDAITSIRGYKKAHKIYMSPKGKTLIQARVKELSKFDHLIILCGHYEGIDERIIDLLIDEEISIGDFVLTGGEIPAMALIDCVARYVPSVLGNEETTKEESFSGENLLEYPQFTRPYEFKGLKVPDVLISGNHKEIAKWRQEQSLKLTKERRPDLLK